MKVTQLEQKILFKAQLSLQLHILVRLLVKDV